MRSSQQAGPDLARYFRYFLGRVIRHLAGEAGIRQFLDIGTGLPTADNTHEVAQPVNPEARTVYVDNDPLILAHANTLPIGDPRGATAYIEADLLDPETIIREARQRQRQPVYPEQAHRRRTRHQRVTHPRGQIRRSHC